MFAGPPCWGHGRTFHLLTLQQLQLQVHRGYFLGQSHAIVSYVKHIQHDKHDNNIKSTQAAPCLSYQG